jgi:hypothetical protein
MVFKSVKVLIATIGLSLGSAAIAENLVYYDTSPTGTDKYYDTETIRRYSNNTVVVWTKEDASKDKTESWSTRKSKFRFNCSTETYGFLYLVLYRANGTVMEVANYEDDFESESIVPESSVDTLFKIVCPR